MRSTTSSLGYVARTPDLHHHQAEQTRSAAAALVETLDGVARGDRAAFEELYRRTSAKLFGVCLRISSSRQEAEEALQEAYLSIWRRAGAFDPARGSAIAWLAVVTRNAAVDRRRRERPTTSSPPNAVPEVADDALLVSDLLGAADDVRRLHECLAALGDGDAHMIRTAFLDGRSYGDLAAASGMPLGTVKSRIRRAFLKLRECLR